MDKSGLSVEAENFLVRYVDSVADLEVLLVLQSGRERWWSPEQVQEKVQTSVASVTKSLTGLAAFGLVSVSAAPASSYRYEPKSPELDQQVLAVVAAYRERPVRVLELIYSKPSERLRTFADAFKLRKDTRG